MKNKNIYQEKLYHHTMPVREGLWEAIEAQLPPKKEERVFPLFWFTLFASTLIAGALMFGTLHKNELDKTLPVNDITSTTPSTAENLKLNPTSTTSTESINTNTNSGSSITSAVNKNNASTSPDASAISAKTSLKNNKNNNSTSSASSASSTSSTSLNTAAITANASSPNRLSTSTTASLSPTEIDLLEINSTRELTALHTDPNCYKFTGGTGKYALSADIFAGPGFSPNSFEATDGESSTYAAAREVTEHQQYAWSAGARVNLLLRNGLGLRLGLNYTQVGDLFDYTDTLATRSTTAVDSFFAADGTFLYADTSRVLVFGTLIKKIHNTYRYLDIPLLASFEMPFGRSMFMINAGPVFNLTSSHEGQILNSDLIPGSITPGEPNEIPVYKTNVGMSLYLGAGIVFPISDHISGLVEPSFLYRLKPVTLDSYPLKEHRHYAGLNLGIRYHFK